MRCRIILFVLFFVHSFVNIAQTDMNVYTVIAGPNSDRSLSTKALIDIYGGDRNRWENGTSIVVVMPSKAHPDAEKFAKIIFGENFDSMRRYWLGLVFQGRNAAPIYLDSDKEILEFVKETKGSIAVLIDSTYNGKLKLPKD